MGPSISIVLRSDRVITAEDDVTVVARRPYRPPHLTPYGDVRDLTLGSSPGAADSGGYGKPPLWGPPAGAPDTSFERMP